MAMALENRFTPAIAVGFLILALSMKAQSQDGTALPLVFNLGDDQPAYGRETISHYISLSQACDNDMKVAFGRLSEMVSCMEEFARQQRLDLNGVRAWMHFFWSENGKLEHIGFYLKPGSRQIDEDTFADFLRDFTLRYRMVVSTDQKFAHYASFSFSINGVNQLRDAANKG